MDNYIGVKLIQAEPMNRGDYNTKRGWLVPADENPADEGYLVQYPDGYLSWSPKAQFEDAYLPIGADATRITPPVVEAVIAEVTTQQVDPKTCLVKSEQITGFTQYATAACVSPENYDEKIGSEIGMREIRDRLWFALGFVLQWARFGLKNVEKKERQTV